MAARLNRAHLDLCREKIQTSQLINRLQGNALGTVELTPVQQRSIEILLRKTLPDLSAVQHSGQIESKRADEMTDNELATIASRGSEQATNPQIDPSQLN